MKQGRDDEDPADKDRFANQEGYQIPSLGTRDLVIGGNPAANHFFEIIKEFPLDHYDAIQGPQIKVLPPMNLEPLLMWSQPAEGPVVDVGVVARDVGKGVMEDGVFPVPQV